ncbi:E3 ubiquitin/ISG15 ligase TRIM25-like isoform X2 [Genypterus blacodes]
MMDAPFSLMSLEDELSCSICLSPFYFPVTIPCGHNFCQDCLLSTWDKDTYSCPQCRTQFATRPELKKNTVLSAVVDTFRMRSSKSEGPDLCAEVTDLSAEGTGLSSELSTAPKDKQVRCDTCMEAAADQTCLTCMASFCTEHLRPHRENPNFRLHQLSEPLGDLSERICPQHHKLMELFCVQHDRIICSFCLQQVHQGCSFSTLDQQRHTKESDLRAKLSLLDVKVEKTETFISQMAKIQNKIKDGADNRKAALSAEYQQMRDMLVLEEREALSVVERELHSGQTKVRDLEKKFNENIELMSKAKEDINNLMFQSQTPAFLQASFDLPSVVKFEPYTPRVNMDSKVVTATQDFSAMLKEHLSTIFKQPVEARLLQLKPGDVAAPVSAVKLCSPGGAGLLPQPQPWRPPVHHHHPRPLCPLPRPRPPYNPYLPNYYMQWPTPQLSPWHPEYEKRDFTQQSTQRTPRHSKGKAANMKAARSMENLLFLSKKDKDKGGQ